MLLEVIRELDKHTLETVQLAANAVWFMEYDRRKDRIVIHAQDGTYYMNGSIKHLEIHLRDEGYRFLEVDRGTLINADNIVWINLVRKEAFFEPYPTRKSKRCSIAHHRFLNTVDELHRMNPSLSITSPA